MANTLAENATMPVLRISGLNKRFPSFQLGPLDLEVPSGAVYALIGPNGAGKTTTLDLVMGMGMPDAGTIEVFGLDHRRDEVAIKLRTGYVSPELNYAAWKRIDRLLHFIRPFYPAWDEAYCQKLLQLFELRMDSVISTLSLGQRSRLNLVLALAHRPDLLILDEPTTGLDPIGKSQFFKEMLTLLETDQRTVIISSNNLTDLERFADHIGLLDRGKLLLQGRIDSILDQYRIMDVRASDGMNPAHWAGVRILEKGAERWRLLINMTERPAQLTNAEILSEGSLTLEDLFVALLGKETQS